MKIPGTEIPLCLCCEDDAATTTDPDIGVVCNDCAYHAAQAGVALIKSGLHRQTEIKKS